MNHLKTGNAYFAQGSYKSNKYNGKELQETGMYSYGWREYMPDIARWNGIDQLAESYLSASPYAYVLNNPINMFDPDGREVAYTAWQDMWNATPDGSNSYWYNNGSGFTSYDGGDKGGHGGGGSLAYGSTVGYGGGFTMGDGVYTLPPVIINGSGNASNWNKGDNYFPNIFAMGMAFNQSLASWNYQNGGGSADSFRPVLHNGSAYMMSGDMFGFTDLLGVLFSSMKPENREAAMGLAAIAIITTKGRAAPAILKSELAIEKGILSTERGAFSVADWTNYPSAIPKPTGPFKILEGAEYEAARKAANKANQAIRRANPEAYKGLEIHEIHPVKYGGSATDPLNKIAIPREYHRKVVTPWWNDNMRSIYKIP